MDEKEAQSVAVFDARHKSMCILSISIFIHMYYYVNTINCVCVCPSHTHTTKHTNTHIKKRLQNVSDGTINSQTQPLNIGPRTLTILHLFVCSISIFITALNIALMGGG